MRSRLRQNPTVAAHLALLAVVLVWGTTFALVKSALGVCSPLLFNLLRMAIATAALLAINSPALRSLSRPHLRAGALAGLFLALGYQLQTAGLALTTPSKSAFITGLVVVFVPLLAAIRRIRPATMHPTRWNGYLGALVAFLGLVLLTTPPGSGLALLHGIGLGEILTLGCSITYAAHLLTLARVSPSVPPRVLGTLQIAFATLVMLVTLPAERHIHIHFTGTLIAALLVTGLLATAAAFTIQSWAQRHLPANHTALIFTLEPVFAWLTSLLFLHEHLGRRELLGALLILAGIACSELLSSSPVEPTAIPAA